MNKLKLAAICSTMMISSVVFAQTTSTTPATPSAGTAAKVPSGVTSVDKNLAKDPDNKGLRNASQRLERNQDRKELKKHKAAHHGQPANVVAVKPEKSAAKAVRAETAERVEKAERPAKAERIERVERPEKIARPSR